MSAGNDRRQHWEGRIEAVSRIEPHRGRWPHRKSSGGSREIGDRSSRQQPRDQRSKLTGKAASRSLATLAAALGKPQVLRRQPRDWRSKLASQQQATASRGQQYVVAAWRSRAPGASCLEPESKLRVELARSAKRHSPREQASSTSQLPGSRWQRERRARGLSRDRERSW